MHNSVYDLDKPVSDEPAVASAPAYWFATLALVGITLVGALAWLVRGEPAAEPPKAVGEAVALAVAEIVEAAEPVAAVRKAAVVDAGTVEVCGVGRVTPEALRSEHGSPEWLDAPMRETEQHTIERLLARGDERSRAAGQFLRAASIGIDSAIAHYEALDREGVDCAKQACAEPPVVPEVARAREALIRLAVSTRDPWVYALAYQGCLKTALLSGVVPACQMVSVERWTQLEPDNAVAWLHAASAAKERGDAAGVAEALYRASQAKRADARFGQLGAVARQQQPSDLAPAVGWLLDTQSVGLEAAFVLPGYGTMSEHCSKNALADPNRRAVCEALAGMLVERSTSPIDLSIGLTIGKRLHWPAQRIEALEESRDALQAMALDLPHTSPDGTPRLDCAAVAEQRDHLRQVAELGELGALRQRLAQSGQDAATLATRHRAAMARLQREAATTAAAANTPPDGMLRTASTTP